MEDTTETKQYKEYGSPVQDYVSILNRWASPEKLTIGPCPNMCVTEERIPDRENHRSAKALREELAW